MQILGFLRIVCAHITTQILWVHVTLIHGEVLSRVAWGVH